MERTSQIVSYLQSIKEEIAGNVAQAIVRINLPKEETTISPVESSDPKQDKTVLIAGIVLFVIGLIAKKVLSAICLTLGFGGVGYYLFNLYSRNKKNPTEPTVKKSIDYTSESQRIFNILKKTHSVAAEKWDNAVIEQSSLMKVHIDNSTLESQNKSRAYDVLAKRSSVSFPMMDVLQKLMSCKSSSDYRQYLDSFSRDYAEALDRAFKEESVKYQEIEQILINQ